MYWPRSASRGTIWLGGKCPNSSEFAIATKRWRSSALSLFLGDIDPYDYFVDVLQRVGQHPAHLVHQLTPRLWKDLFAANPLRSNLPV